MRPSSGSRSGIDDARYAPFDDGAVLVAEVLCRVMRDMPLPSASAQLPPGLTGTKLAKMPVLSGLQSRTSVQQVI